MSSRLVIAGFALLTTVALIGWTGRSSTEFPQQPHFAQEQTAQAPVPANEPAAAYPIAGAPAAHAAETPYAASRTSGERYASQPGPRRLSHSRVRRERPTSHSVAIVGASAGTGAAIGALAGGGRGAGIGALAGGAAGFIYDRLTHDR
jgi:hypothetical protein